MYFTQMYEFMTNAHKMYTLWNVVHTLLTQYAACLYTMDHDVEQY